MPPRPTRTPAFSFWVAPRTPEEHRSCSGSSCSMWVLPSACAEVACFTAFGRPGTFGTAASQRGQTRRPGSSKADLLRLEAPSRLRTATLLAPSQSWAAWAAARLWSPPQGTPPKPTYLVLLPLASRLTAASSPAASQKPCAQAASCCLPRPWPTLGHWASSSSLRAKVARILERTFLNVGPNI